MSYNKFYFMENFVKNNWKLDLKVNLIKEKLIDFSSKICTYRPSLSLFIFKS